MVPNYLNSVCEGDERHPVLVLPAHGRRGRHRRRPVLLLAAPAHHRSRCRGTATSCKIKVQREQLIMYLRNLNPGLTLFNSRALCNY